MSKLTKQTITEKTSTGGVFGSYTCQLEMNRNYTVSYVDGRLYHNQGNNTFDTMRIVETKKEFINAIYELEND